MSVPNRISIFRLLLIPVIVLLKTFPYAQFGFVIPNARIGFITISYLNFIILAIFVVASISDMVDGYIARKYNQITTFGKFVDPIADKVLTTTLFVIFAVDGIVPIIVVVIMIGRDIIVDGLRMLAAEKGIVMAAGVLGKAKTAVQMVAICLILLNNLPFALFGFPAADVALWLSLLLSVASAVTYFTSMSDIMRESQ